MKMKLDLSKFKKISQDDKIAVLEHPDGHRFHVAIQALHPLNRKNLDSLEQKAEDSEKMSDGGKVEPKRLDPKKGDPEYSGLENKADPEKRAKAADSLKKAFNFAAGGKVKAEQETKLEIEKLDKPEPKEHIEYEAIKAEHPVEYEKLADGGEVAETPIPSIPGENGVPMSAATPPPAVQATQQPPQAQMSPTSDMPEAAPQGLAQPMPAAQPQPAAPPDMMHGYQQQVQGIQGEAQAMADKGQAETQAFNSQAQQAGRLMSDYDKHYQDLETERKAFQQDVMDSHIDPHRYLGSLSSGDRFMTAVALTLGGLGASHGGPNQGLEFLNRQIDRDIDAQKQELGKKETLLSSNLRQFGNMRDATEMTRVMMNDMIGAQVKKAEAKAQSPLAKARAQQMLGQLEQQTAPTVQKMATVRALEGAGQDGAGMIKADPAQFVPSIVPKEHQEAVYKELERAQNTKQVADTAMHNYDKIAKQMSSLTGRIGAAAYTPAELQALEAELGSTVGDMEGTVRETAMHNVKNAYLPRSTDTPERLAQRRAELQNYLKLKSAAPRAKSFGIDLNKFESTSKSPQLNAQQQQFAQWAKANPQDPRSAMVLKKLGLQ